MFWQKLEGYTKFPYVIREEVGVLVNSLDGGDLHWDAGFRSLEDLHGSIKVLTR